MRAAAQKRKKQRTEPPLPVLSSPLNPSVFESAAEHRARHDSSGPYRHVVLPDLCDAERMRLVHAEATTNMTATFKETDLFKVFQTPEMATYENNAKMAQLMALRTALYSAEFRALVREVTGCGELTDRVDCSANVYTTGCHLLCHDDVIGTRRVSYIIYLTDPDEPWNPEDGGALELYPLDRTASLSSAGDVGEQGVPEPSPTATILPRFNTMAMFTVQPGRSYHAVQEVYAQDKPRLSISGWYHGPEPPAGSDMASLAQIMSLGDDSRPFAPTYPGLYTLAAPPPDDALALSGGYAALTTLKGAPKVHPAHADVAELQVWVNEEYLRAGAMDRIRAHMCEHSSVQLQDFLKDDVAAAVIAGAVAADKADGLGAGRAPAGYAAGAGGGWAVVGPPHKRRHLVYTAPAPAPDGAPAASSSSALQGAAPGAALDAIRTQLFRSPAFARYLARLTALTVVGSRDEVRRFRAGLDYTVAHYGAMTAIPRLDATLCFVDTKGADGADRGAGAGAAEGAKKKGGAERWSSGGDDDDAEAAKEEEENKEDAEDEDEEDEDEDEDGNPWGGGDLGGFECYIEEHGDSAAEVYRPPSEEEGAEDEGTLLSVTAGANVLSLVMRDQGIMRFVKYVSASAPGSRWDVTVEYEIVQPEGDEDNEEDGDEDGAEDDA